MTKTNLRTLTYRTVERKVITYEYTPGMYLNEEISTEELKISRILIRDVLSRLEREGLIEIKPKKGVTVTSPSIKDTNMILEIRKLYGPYTLKDYGSFLLEDKFHESYYTFSHKDASSECFQNNNYLYDLDSSFHQMIVDTCFNIYLRQNYALIQTRSERLRFMTGSISDNHLEDTSEEHISTIIPCLERGWDAASERLLYHLDESKKSTFRLVSDSIDSNNTGSWLVLDINEEGLGSSVREWDGGGGGGCWLQSRNH